MCSEILLRPGSTADTSGRCGQFFLLRPNYCHPLPSQHLPDSDLLPVQGQARPTFVTPGTAGDIDDRKNPAGLTAVVRCRLMDGKTVMPNHCTGFYVNPLRPRLLQLRIAQNAVEFRQMGNIHRARIANLTRAWHISHGPVILFYRVKGYPSADQGGTANGPESFVLMGRGFAATCFFEERLVLLQSLTVDIKQLCRCAR